MIVDVATTATVTMERVEMATTASSGASSNRREEEVDLRKGF